MISNSNSGPGRFAWRRIFVYLLFAMPALAQTPSEFRQILDRLELLEEQNRALAAEVRALRGELTAARAPVETDTAPSAAPSIQERIEVQETRTAEQAQAKVEASQRFPLRITGMALFNAFLNSSGSGGNQNPTLAIQGSRKSGGATVRQTVIGLAYSGPTTIWNGKVNGALQMDFFGGAGTALDQDFRVRTATIGIDWRDRAVRFGLEKPLIAPRDPNSLAQVALSPLTGAGNLWVWIPQVRFEQKFRFGDRTGVRAQVAAMQTREVRGDSPGPLGDPAYPEEVAAARPGVETRIEFFSGGDRRIEIAPGWHYSVTHVGGNSVPSSVFSLDWLFRPWRPLGLTGTFFSGQNVSHFGIGGIRQGFVVFGPKNVVPVHSRGGWAQIEYNATSRLSFNLFSGQHDDRNSDLLPGRIGKNLALGANVMYRLAPNVLASFEVSQLRTVYLQSGTVLNNHYDLGIAYLF